VTRLENLDEISTLIGRLAAMESGAPLPQAPPADGGLGALKKKFEPAAGPELTAPTPSAAPAPTSSPSRDRDDQPRADESTLPPLEIESVRQIWGALEKKVGLGLALVLSQAKDFVAISGPNVLAFRLPPGYNRVADECDTPESRPKIEQALASLLHRQVIIRFERSAEAPETQAEGDATAAPVRRREEVLEGDPLVRKVVELFEARLLHPEYDDDPPRPSSR
jgi:DNA polymerase-3 subunit gamma/tau